MAVAHLYLRTIAPGAAALLKQIDANGVPGTKKVNALDVEDFRTIVQAFEHWPFAPKVMAPSFIFLYGRVLTHYRLGLVHC